MSAITLLGTPAEIYVYGTQYVALVISYPILVAATAYMYLPVFFKLGISTSYEVVLIISYLQADHCDMNNIYFSIWNGDLISGSEYWHP